MVSINGNFIGSFKIGDNIQRNLAMLRLLYVYFNAETHDNQALLCKCESVKCNHLTLCKNENSTSASTKLKVRVAKFDNLQETSW